MSLNYRVVDVGQVWKRKEDSVQAMIIKIYIKTGSDCTNEISLDNGAVVCYMDLIQNWDYVEDPFESTLPNSFKPVLRISFGL